VGVDARQAERAPLGVALGVVVAARQVGAAGVVRVEVGVHRGLEAAFGARQ
jgi:hypothetical protein